MSNLRPPDGDFENDVHLGTGRRSLTNVLCKQRGIADDFRGLGARRIRDRAERCINVMKSRGNNKAMKPDAARQRLLARQQPDRSG